MTEVMMLFISCVYFQWPYQLDYAGRYAGVTEWRSGELDDSGTVVTRYW